MQKFKERDDLKKEFSMIHSFSPAPIFVYNDFDNNEA